MANNLEVGIKLNDNISAGLNKINGNLNNLKGNVDKVNQSTSKIGSSGGIFQQMLGANIASTAITGGIDMVISGVQKLGTAVFDAYTNSENYLTKLTGMLGGNTEAAKMHAEELQKFAASTPFGLQQLQAADSQMLAYGYSVDEVLAKMQTFGDVASGAGADVNDIIRVMGQIKSKGKADTQDIMQLQEKGIPVLKNLQKQLGLSGEQVSKMVQTGQIGEKEVTKVFEELTNEGGLFYKAMELQSKTLTGRISNFMDNLYVSFVKIGEIFRPVIDTIFSFVESLMSSLDVELLTNVAKAFAGIAIVIVQMLDPIMNILGPILTLLGEQFIFVSNIIQTLWTELSTLLLPIFDELSVLITIISNVMQFQLKVAFEALKVVIQVVVAALKPLGILLQNVISGISDIYIAMINMINDILKYFNLETIKLPKTKAVNVPGAKTETGDKKTTPINTPVVGGLSTQNQPRVETISSQQPKIVNVNILSGSNASLIQKLEVSNIIDKSGKLTQDFKNEIEQYLLTLLYEGSSSFAQ